MITIALVFVLLALLPIIIVTAFRRVLVEKKAKRLTQEIAQMAAEDIFHSVDNLDVKNQVEQFFGKARLFPPAIILSGLYLLNFWFMHAYMIYRFPGWANPPREFPEYLLRNAFGISLAFAGLYTFNLGAIVRRLYLVDLTEHVFWGAINRYVLTLAIAVMFGLSGIETLNTQKSMYVPWLYFAIGFLATFLLDALLDRAADVSGLLNRGAKKAPEYSLELIRGIDLWKDYRFEEEGIESVQNLATADLQSLALKTRYTIKTLTDWMDQAILIHRLGDKASMLWEHGIEASAIELASRSPANNNNSPESIADAANIAKALQLEAANVEQLMNSLFWDETVRTLWRVWQKKDDWTGAQSAPATAGQGALNVPGSEVVTLSTTIAGAPTRMVVTSSPISAEQPAPTNGTQG